MGRKRKSPESRVMSKEEFEQFQYVREMKKNEVDMAPMVAQTLIQTCIDDNEACFSSPNPRVADDNSRNTPGTLETSEKNNLKKIDVGFQTLRKNESANKQGTEKNNAVDLRETSESPNDIKKVTPVKVMMELRWIQDPTRPLSVEEKKVCEGVSEVERYIPELDRVPLRLDDVHRTSILESSGKLDSTIIDVWAELLSWRSICPERQVNIMPSYIFSQFFLSSIFEGWKVAIGENASEMRNRAKAGKNSQLPFKIRRAIGKELQRVGIKLKGMKIIFFPLIIAENHWGLVIVDLRKKEILFYDPLKNVGKARFIISHVCLWLEKCKSEELAFHVHENFKKWPKKLVCHEFPTQGDGASCGVFVVWAIEYIQRGQIPKFTQDDIQNLRQRLWFYIVKTGNVIKRE